MTKKTLSKLILLLLISITLQPCLLKHQLIAQPADEDGLQAAEKESLQKAKDPEEQFKIYLEIASGRLKDLLSACSKQEKEAAGRAALGFRTAVSGADDCVANAQAKSKNTKKLTTTLSKAVKKYNFSLILALEKAPEDFRKYIQSAFEVSARVGEGIRIQLEHQVKK